MPPIIDAPQNPERLHQLLASSHSARLLPSVETLEWEQSLQREVAVRRIEHEFVEAERAALGAVMQSVPTDVDAFVGWFEALRDSGPGQHDTLFPWLAEIATHDEMCWFLRQEMAGEAGFDDLVALTQIKFPKRPKLEMARNYWDEMGQGMEGGMHGPMLERLAAALQLPKQGETVWEALALGNLMVALATERRYAYQSVGALGVIELTAPGRSALVNAGLRRLGIRGAARQYYALHATLDARHSAAWNGEVLASLVAENPKVASAIAEGALLRLRAGARCFERYRRELWGSSNLSSAQSRDEETEKRCA
jgi:hypothetical protein